MRITRPQVREDRPIAISSKAFGANLNAFGINIDLIALKDPGLATALISNIDKAQRIRQSDPDAPSEDFELFNEALRKFLRQDNAE